MLNFETMVRKLLIILIGIGLYSCNDCNDCGSFNTEPLMQLQFLNATDGSPRIVIIDSVNYQSSSISRTLDDTASTFQLPLNMNADMSVVNLVLRDTTDLLTSISGIIEVSYNREFERRSDNFIIVNCFVNDVNVSFQGLELYCNDSINQTCKSDGLTAKISF